MNFRSTVRTLYLVLIALAAGASFAFSAADLLKGLASYSDLMYGIGFPLAFISALISGKRANAFSWQLCSHSLLVALAVSTIGFVPAVFAMGTIWAVVIVVVGSIFLAAALGESQSATSADTTLS